MVPYFGVSGFTHRSQVDSFINYLVATPPMGSQSLAVAIANMDRCVHLGFHINEKVLKGLTSHSRQSVDIHTLRDLLSQHSAPKLPVPCINTIHYAGPVSFEVLADIVRTSPNVHAIQIESSWPETSALKRFKSRYPAIHLIIRIDPAAHYEAGNSWASLLRRIYSYEDTIDGIIFCPCSHIEPLATMEPILKHLPGILERFPEEISVAIHGGINESCVHEIRLAITEIRNRNLPTHRISIQTMLETPSLAVESAKFLFMSAIAFSEPR